MHAGRGQVRRLGRRGKVLAFVLVTGLVAAFTIPATAALADPSLKASAEHDDVVAVRGKAFPKDSRVSVVATVPNGRGETTVTAGASGTFAAAFQLPAPDWKGTVSFVATSGTTKATAKLVVGPTTSTTAAPTGGTLTYNGDGVAATDLKLSKARVAVGEEVAASVTVRTKQAVTFKELAVSMRDSRKIDGPGLDFPHDLALTVNGSKVVTHARSEDHADTYTVDVAYTLDGKTWKRLASPIGTFTVVAADGSGTTPTTAKPPTPTTQPPASGVQQPTIGGTWKLAFNDEFTGSSLDLTKWIMCNPSFASSCNPYNNEQEKFRTTPGNPNVKVSGGQLHLIATKENGQVYSGMVSTGPNKWNYDQPGYKGFQFTYGYYEGRVRIPKGNGFWPSMWMLPDQAKYGAWPGSGEYDVFEIPGNDPTEYHFTAHWAGGGVCGHACTPQEAHIADASAGFHTFGLDWEPTGLTWYVDGKKMGNTVTDGGAIKKTPFYIIANFSVGGSWGPLNGAPDGSTPFPASMDIDYLRVWQHP